MTTGLRPEVKCTARLGTALLSNLQKYDPTLTATMKYLCECIRGSALNHLVCHLGSLRQAIYRYRNAAVQAEFRLVGAVSCIHLMLWCGTYLVARRISNQYDGYSIYVAHYCDHPAGNSNTISQFLSSAGAVRDRQTFGRTSNLLDLDLTPPDRHHIQRCFVLLFIE